MSSRELLPLVYDELRKLAAAKLAAVQPGFSQSWRDPIGDDFPDISK